MDTTIVMKASSALRVNSLPHSCDISRYQLEIVPFSRHLERLGTQVHFLRPRSGFIDLVQHGLNHRCVFRGERQEILPFREAVHTFNEPSAMPECARWDRHASRSVRSHARPAHVNYELDLDLRLVLHPAPVKQPIVLMYTLGCKPAPIRRRWGMKSIILDSGQSCVWRISHIGLD